MADFASGLIDRLRISSPATQTAPGNLVMGNAGVAIVNKTAGQATQVTLTARAGAGDFAIVKDGKGDAGANNITIVPDGTANNTTIDGAANLVLSTNRQSVILMHNGTEWSVIAIYP